MAFKDVSFPNKVAQGSTGGPGFNTTVVSLASGDEQRNINWALGRNEWDVSTGIRSRADMDLVRAHFYVMRGRGYSFPFKDWNDYSASGAAMVPITATTFQLVKRYNIGGEEFVRPITKPVLSTVVVRVGASVVTPLSVSRLTGVVTFSSAPGPTPTADFEFDLPMRYDTDKLPVTAQAYTQQVASSINLIEVRE